MPQIRILTHEKVGGIRGKAMKNDVSRNKRHACIIVLLAFMMVSPLFLTQAVEDAKADRSRSYWSIDVSGDNIGLAGQSITVYFNGKGKSASPNSYFSGNDGGGYSATFSFTGDLTAGMVESISAKSADGSTAGMSSWGQYGSTIEVSMQDIGVPTAYLKVYATNKENVPVTFSVEKGAQSMGMFTVPASAYEKYVGKVQQDDFITNIQNPTWFTAVWGDGGVWEQDRQPGGNYGLDWGAGKGGTADRNPPEITFTIGATKPTVTGSVNPASGNSSINYTFTATYKHTDGDQIFAMYVYIDGTSYIMTKNNATSGTEKTGINYAYTTQLSAGSHEYYFSARWKKGTQDTTSKTMSVTEAPPPPPPPPTPEPKITLSPSDQLGECYPGRSTSYRITASNTGDAAGSVTFAATPQLSGWTARVVNETGVLVSSPVSIAPQESKTLTLNITAASGASTTQTERTSISASVGGSAHSTVTTTTMVREFPGVSLVVADMSEKTFWQGETRVYAMNARNEYDQNNSVTLSVSQGWNASLIDSDMASPLNASFVMAVGESKDFYVRLTAPSLDADDQNTYGGAFINTTITARSNTLSKQATSGIKSTIQTETGLNFTTLSPASGDLTGALGRDLTYTLSASNEGNVPDIFDAVSAFGTGNWTGRTKLTSDAAGTTTLSDTNRVNGADTGTIPVGGAVQIYLKLTIPSELPQGASENDAETIIVKGKSALSGEDVNATLVARVQTPGIELTPKDQSSVAKPGETATYYFTAANYQKVGGEFEFRCNSSMNATAVFLDPIADSEMAKIGASWRMVFGVGDTKTVALKLTLPENATVASVDSSSITVRSISTGKSDAAYVNTTVLPVAGLSMSLVNKTSDAAKATYFLNITNKGNAPDRINVVYSATLPLSNSSASFENGTPLSDTDADGKADLGPLAANSTRTIRIITDKPTGAPAGYINRLTVSADSSWTPAKYKTIYPALNTTDSALNEIIDASLGQSGHAEIMLDSVVTTDLIIESKDVRVFSKGKLASVIENGSAIQINVTVRNIGGNNANSTKVVAYEVSDDGTETQIGEAEIQQIAANSSKSATITYFPNYTGQSGLNISVRLESILDSNSTNDETMLSFALRYASAQQEQTTAGYNPQFAAFGALCGIAVVGAVAARTFKRRELL